MTQTDDLGILSSLIAVQPFIAQFTLQGRLDNVRCPLDAPLSGLVRVAECDAKIRSVEVQLVRVETVQVRILCFFVVLKNISRKRPYMAFDSSE